MPVVSSILTVIAFLATGGLVAINGIQDRSRYLMPAYGGFYRSLDEAAAEVFRQTLGPGVDVVPILCGESQRRVGAVHCSAAAYPRVESP